MPKIPRITFKEAESILSKAGFELIRSKGSHKIYRKNSIRIIIPCHTNKVLHPKIIKQIIRLTNIDS